MYSVYMLRVPDGRVYIGTTAQDIKRRWNNGNGYRFSPALWEQIRRHGWEHIDKMVLADGLTEEEACKLEQEKIRQHMSYKQEYGFNREMGGIFTKKIVPDNVKAHMSETRKGVLNHNYGKHFTKEHREKIAESNRGQKRSEETKEKLRKVHSKAVSQYTVSGIYIATYESGVVAENVTGISKHSISKVCLGKAKTGGGFLWRFD